MHHKPEVVFLGLHLDAQFPGARPARRARRQRMDGVQSEPIVPRRADRTEPALVVRPGQAEVRTGVNTLLPDDPPMHGRQRFGIVANGHVDSQVLCLKS